MNDFEEYIRQSEPHKREKGYAWQTAIGLQAVDGLKPSEYFEGKKPANTLKGISLLTRSNN